jgi:hypothetical protein
LEDDLEDTRFIYREAKEESGLDVVEMEQVGLLEFQFDDKMHEILQANVFNVTKYSGEPYETEGSF